MKAVWKGIGYALAAILLLLGADETIHLAYREWYFDGTITFDAAGHEVPYAPTVWLGPGLLVIGVLIAGAVHQLGRQR
jgi:hypothetical protein